MFIFSKAEFWVRGKHAFSLVELMVAVGIVAIVVTLAWPRFQQFMVQARRGEAKSNLTHLANLQETYRVEHFSYYRGEAMTGVNGIGYKDGIGTRSKHGCGNVSLDEDKGLCNYLGFHPVAANELRYFYQFRGGTAVASAASDRDGKYIYPDCNGGGEWRCGYPSGDALTMALDGGRPTVCRNITKYCPLAGGFTVNGSGHPSCGIASCGNGYTLYPYPRCCEATCDSTTKCCDASGNEITYCQSNPYKSWTGHPSCGCGACTNSCGPGYTQNASTCNCDPVLPPPCLCTTNYGDWPRAISHACKGTIETVNVKRSFSTTCTPSSPPPPTCPPAGSYEESKNIPVNGNRGTSPRDLCVATGGSASGGVCTCPARRTYFDYDGSACAGSGCSCPRNAQETACVVEGGTWTDNTCNCARSNETWRYNTNQCGGECVHTSTCDPQRKCCNTSVDPHVPVPRPTPAVCPTDAAWYGTPPDCCHRITPDCPSGTVKEPVTGRCICKDPKRRKSDGTCCRGHLIWRNSHCTCPPYQYKIKYTNRCTSGGFDPRRIPRYITDDPCIEKLKSDVGNIAAGIPDNNTSPTPCEIVCVGAVKMLGEPDADYARRNRKELFECWMRALVDCRVQRNPATSLADLDRFVSASQDTLITKMGEDECAEPSPTPTPSPSPTR